MQYLLTVYIPAGSLQDAEKKNLYRLIKKIKLRKKTGHVEVFLQIV